MKKLFCPRSLFSFTRKNFIYNVAEGRISDVKSQGGDKNDKKPETKEDQENASKMQASHERYQRLEAEINAMRQAGEDPSKITEAAIQSAAETLKGKINSAHLEPSEEARLMGLLDATVSALKSKAQEAEKEKKKEEDKVAEQAQNGLTDWRISIFKPMSPEAVGKVVMVGAEVVGKVAAAGSEILEGIVESDINKVKAIGRITSSAVVDTALTPFRKIDEELGTHMADDIYDQVHEATGIEHLNNPFADDAEKNKSEKKDGKPDANNNQPKQQEAKAGSTEKPKEVDKNSRKLMEKTVAQVVQERLPAIKDLQKTAGKKTGADKVDYENSIANAKISLGEKIASELHGKNIAPGVYTVERNIHIIVDENGNVAVDATGLDTSDHVASAPNYTPGEGRGKHKRGKKGTLEKGRSRSEKRKENENERNAVVPEDKVGRYVQDADSAKGLEDILNRNTSRFSPSEKAALENGKGYGNYDVYFRKGKFEVKDRAGQSGAGKPAEGGGSSEQSDARGQAS